MTAPGRGAGGADRARGRPRNEEASLAIARAALRQVQVLGFANLSMESVALEAGVAKATVYRRFRDKADLITAAIAGWAAATGSAEVSADPRGDLVRFLGEFDQRFGEYCLEVIGALMAGRHDSGAMALYRQRVVGPRMDYARRLLARARELGHIDPDTDLDVAVQLLAGGVFARRVEGIPSDPAWAERAVDQLWAGVSPRTVPVPVSRS